MLPSENNTPTFLQVYFFDPNWQSEHRVASMRFGGEFVAEQHHLDVEIYQILHQCLTEHHSYIQSFLTVKEYLDRLEVNPTELCIQLHATSRPGNGEHPGRYHLPTAPEISLLMPTNPPADAMRSIICAVRQGNENLLQTFQDYHRSYDPLQYPLIFPYGTDGWTLNLKSNNPLHN
jgi:hypothetical protein